MATMGWFTAGGWDSAPPYQLGLRPNLCIPYAPQSTSLPCQLASGEVFNLDTAYTVWCHRVGQNVTLPSVPMIEMQIQITWQLRSSLIDFVVRSHQYFRLPSQVLFLSVNLIDRYCSRKQIGKEYYLLLGSAALWIASKYDGKAYQGKGFTRPSAKEISELCNGIFDEHMIAQMEISILYTLDWVLGHPTTDQGIKFLLVGEPGDKELASMAAYLSEISLYHREFVGVKPSIIAESCCMLAKIILYGSLSIGDDTEAVVMETLNSLWKHVCQPPPAIAEKFLRQNRHYVAQIVFNRLADSTGHATYDRQA
ncbi:cyclin domain-containing protein [Fusarium oxysporum f. sp. raphani 54005]|uniref:Cyclin domain-containing protein n=1 Tax=Fusarium oxysporum f. sp. raphani 54005 TaxID=1089458 RepID=X0C624_FUSOX|nr:cyclin domain-containing protein [Fusarium oxysporum f. sp. raphani 54005]